MAKTKAVRARSPKVSTSMRVQDLMTGAPCACRITDSANDAARVMWERDCGSVPVVSDDGRILGIVTDRDICMAAYFQGRPLGSIPLDSIMTTQVATCRAGDDVEEAERLMRERQVNRLPVVADGEVLVGMLALCDLTRGVTRAGALQQKSTEGQQLLETVAAIREPRTPREMTS
jgi:CBS domain-containing protein